MAGCTRATVTYTLLKSALYKSVFASFYFKMHAGEYVCFGQWSLKCRGTLSSQKFQIAYPVLRKKISTLAVPGGGNGIAIQAVTGRWLYTGLDTIALLLAQQFRATSQIPHQAVMKGVVYSQILAAQICGQGARSKFCSIVISMTVQEVPPCRLPKLMNLFPKVSRHPRFSIWRAS